VGAGLRLNFPMIAQGDYFQSQVNYTQGGLRYLNMANNSPNYGWERGGNFGFGVMSDCVYGSLAAPLGGPVVDGTGCNLTTAWEVNASYEHYWTPQFHESFVVGYEQAQYNTQANAILCTAELTAAGTNTGTLAVAPAGCNNNWALWSGATRFQYDVTKSLYLGVEFLYSHLDTATLPGNVLGTAFGASRLLPANNDLNVATQIKDQNNLAITARINKDFLP
jgi:hypothetical protein